MLINLVDNAIKYSPDGGRVDVHVRQVGGRVRFSVIDRGLGIPLAEQRRIFEKFYRLDPNMTRGVGGTGLGLYICRELVRRMDGRIWVESGGLGRGSTFNIEFPSRATSPRTSARALQNRRRRPVAAFANAFLRFAGLVPGRRRVLDDGRAAAGRAAHAAPARPEHQRQDEADQRRRPSG